MLTETEGQTLCSFARAVIAEKLGGPAATSPTAEAFLQPGACFVTLFRGGGLHGCIGSLEAFRPLWLDVSDNACSAAFRDPRATALALGDEQQLAVEVSVLSPLQRLTVTNRAEALAAITPHKDGVLLRYLGQRGTFLPQVWDDLPEPTDFWRHLLHKAGLPADFDHPGLQVYRYTVAKWRQGPRVP